MTGTPAGSTTQDSSSAITPTSSSPAATATPAPTALSGTVRVRPMQVIPQSSRDSLLSVASQLEARGYHVAPDGSVLVWPDSPAAGWTVNLGAQHVRVDVDGTFSLMQPTDGATSGTLVHPSDAARTTSFTLEDLGRAQLAGGALVIPVPFFGGCGMSGSDSTDCCLQGCPPGKAALQGPARSANAAADGLRPALSTFFLPPSPNRSGNMPRQVVIRDLTTDPAGYGSYPDPKRAFHFQDCPQFDGFFGTADPNVTQGSIVDYLGSTCDVYVLAGACPYENTLSDAEYDSLFLNPGFDYEVYVRALFGKDLPLKPPVLPTTGDNKIHCFQNHKRRNCGMVAIGDVACYFADDNVLVKTGESRTVTVPPGGSVRFTVHNNGVYGQTLIRKIDGNVGGTLSDAPNPTTDAGLVTTAAGQVIHHYAPRDYAPSHSENPLNPNVKAYVPDLDIVYTAPATAKSGLSETFEFMVDDRKVTITFQTSPPHFEATPIVTGALIQPLGVNLTGSVLYLTGEDSGTLWLHDGVTKSETKILQLANTDPRGTLFEGFGATSTAHCVSDAGDVLYTRYTRTAVPDNGVLRTVSEEYRSFIRHPGGATVDLGFVPGTTYTIAWSMNNMGQVVGLWRTPSTHEKAFIWQDGVITDLNLDVTLGEQDFTPQDIDINDSGDIAVCGANGNLYLIPKSGPPTKLTHAVLRGVDDTGRILYNDNQSGALMLYSSIAGTSTPVKLPAGVANPSVQAGFFPRTGKLLVGNPNPLGVIEHFLYTPDAAGAPVAIPPADMPDGFRAYLLNDQGHVVGVNGAWDTMYEVHEVSSAGAKSSPISMRTNLIYNSVR